MANKQVLADSDWSQARLGKITASKVFNLFTEPRSKAAKEAGELSDGCQTYLNSLLAEMATGTTRSISTYAMEWGHQYEPEAMLSIRESLDKPDSLEYFGADNPQFFKYSSISGGSPDGVAGKTVFEVKCPEDPAVHWKILGWKSWEDVKANKKEWWYQVQMNILAVAKSRDNDPASYTGCLVSYDHRYIDQKLRTKFIDIPLDPDFRQHIDSAIKKAANWMKRELEVRSPKEDKETS